jgi:hypothetical protein
MIAPKKLRIAPTRPLTPAHNPLAPWVGLRRSASALDWTVISGRALGGPETYPTEAEARAAEDEAKRILRTNARVGVTVRNPSSDAAVRALVARPARSICRRSLDATRPPKP